MRLDRYSSGGFQRGASSLTELAWFVVGSLLVASWLPGSGWRAGLLRLFGASIGQGVNFKPGVRIKFPWRLRIGDHCWIGEQVWIDNLAEVWLGDHICISQRAYLCTGSHDWSKETFDLIVDPIRIESHSWICAGSNLAPGAKVGEGAVLCMGSLGAGQLDGWTIYSGVPAQPTGKRVLKRDSD